MSDLHPVDQSFLDQMDTRMLPFLPKQPGMVERVARVMCAASAKMPVHRCGQRESQRAWIDETWPQFEEFSRLAIATMREPTGAMIGAANRNNHPRDVDTWRTMIDEALK